MSIICQSCVEEKYVFRKEIADQKSEILLLRGELEKAVKIADSWIHDQLDGTSSLNDALKELQPCKDALTHHTTHKGDGYCYEGDDCFKGSSPSTGIGEKAE